MDADHDAERVAHGMRLGGKGDALDAALAEAQRPLTVAQVEKIARPDLGPSNSGRGLDHERVGALKLYRVTDTYTIATDDFGWLPGHYVDRDAALVAYGYVLGGEGAGTLDKVKAPAPQGIAVEEIEAYARKHQAEE